MDEQLSTPLRRSSWMNRDGPWLMALLLLVGSLRLWLVYNTEVTARDSIGFIRYSLLFDRMSWSDALCSQHQHPGFPATVWIVSKPVRAVFGTTPDVMRLCAQSVSMTASLLLALMMFNLGKLLWDRYVGFFAALLFQCLPIPGHHLSDGISDGLFLLLTVSAMYHLIRAREENGAWRYALGGAFIGLAYLTRPEGLLVLPAAWLFLIGLQFVRGCRKPLAQVAVGLTALSLSCAAAGSPYYLATGKLTIKPSVRQVIEEAEAGPTERWPLFATLFAANFAPGPNFQIQLQRTLRALFLELCQALNYAGGFLALWAIAFCRKTLFRNVGFTLIAIYFTIHAAILIKLGLTVNYVSDRHVMPIVALLCYPAIIGVMHVYSLLLHWRGYEMPAEGFTGVTSVRILASVVLVGALGVCLSKTVTRLHGNRIGNHQAGLWLAQQVGPGDIVEDDHNWSNYFAGQVFLEGAEPVLPATARPNHFVVMTRSKDAEVREQRANQEEALKKANAQMVYHWPTNADPATARIAVYSMPRDFQTHPWKKDEKTTIVQPVSREK